MTLVTLLPLTRRLTRAATLALSLVGIGGTMACSVASRPTTSGGIAGRPRTVAVGAPTDATQGSPAALPATAMKQEVAQQVAQQLIRRGDMALQVEDVSATARRVERLATAMGGIVAQSSDDGKDDAHVQMRVPSDRLDATMDSVARFGHVERRGTNSQDVTEQLIDLDARIATLTATRDRLRQLMTRSDAIRDVLEVERELGRVQAELESLDRRATQLRGQVAMSDLSVKIDRRIVLGPIGQLFRGIGVVIGKLFVWK